VNFLNLLTQETINRYLELLGLTSQEILILTSILSSSSSLSTLELEKLTNLPKHQIYRALKKLINESLIEELNSSIPKKYLSQTSTIKKFLQSLEEKSNLEKENLSKSNKEDLSNIFMDEEQKLVWCIPYYLIIIFQEMNSQKCLISIMKRLEILHKNFQRKNI
jgi:sugar-specific transcriptional regulator TrmB